MGKSLITLAFKYPELAKQWHPILNGSLTPSNVSPSGRLKVWWKCPTCNADYNASLNNRSRGKGCSYCAGKKVSAKNNLETLYPEIARQWHPIKNKKPATEVLAHSHKSAWWLCKDNHEWEARINNRTSNSHGCPYCSRHCSKALELETFADRCPELIAEWHPTNKLSPHTVSPMSSHKVWWKCIKGHKYETKVSNRAKGFGCPYCKGTLVTTKTSLAFLKPDIAKEWHPTKNGNLKPEQVTRASSHRVWWLCSHCQHEWQTTICNRGRKKEGSSCPNCCRIPSTSLQEIRLWSELVAIFGTAEVSHRNKDYGFELDVLLKTHKIAIEYDGKHWHQHEKKKMLDLNKYEKCKATNIYLIRITEVEGITAADHIVKARRVTKKLINEIVNRLTVLGVTSSGSAAYLKQSEFLGGEYYNSKERFYKARRKAVK